MKKLFCSINVILAICIAMFSSANALDEPVIDIQYFELSPSTNRYIWMAYCYAQSSESDWTGDIVANGEVTNEYGDVIGDGSTTKLFVCEKAAFRYSFNQTVNRISCH